MPQGQGGGSARTTPSAKSSSQAKLDQAKLQKLSKLYDGYNLVINKESIGVSKALHDAQRMLECQSQGTLIANPSLAKKLTTVQKQPSVTSKDAASK